VQATQPQKPEPTTPAIKKLYDRTGDQITLDEVEKIAI
jgi:hypothetical protein